MKKLVNVRFEGHEDGSLQKDLFYAELINEDGTLCISATLDYIMKAIRERGYEVEGITTERYKGKDGIECSTMTLTKYPIQSWGIRKSVVKKSSKTSEKIETRLPF